MVKFLSVFFFSVPFLFSSELDLKCNGNSNTNEVINFEFNSNSDGCDYGSIKVNDRVVCGLKDRELELDSFSKISKSESNTKSSTTDGIEESSSESSGQDIMIEKYSYANMYVVSADLIYMLSLKIEENSSKDSPEIMGTMTVVKEETTNFQISCTENVSEQE